MGQRALSERHRPAQQDAAGRLSPGSANGLKHSPDCNAWLSHPPDLHQIRAGGGLEGHSATVANQDAGGGEGAAKTVFSRHLALAGAHHLCLHHPSVGADAAIADRDADRMTVATDRRADYAAIVEHKLRRGSKRPTELNQEAIVGCNMGDAVGADNIAQVEAGALGRSLRRIEHVDEAEDLPAGCLIRHRREMGARADAGADETAARVAKRHSVALKRDPDKAAGPTDIRGGGGKRAVHHGDILAGLDRLEEDFLRLGNHLGGEQKAESEKAAKNVFHGRNPLLTIERCPVVPPPD